MRLLVVGAAGQLGTALVEVGRHAGCDVVGVGRAECDVTRHEDVLRVVRQARPDVLANAAAFTDVDGAEDHPEAALEVNAYAVWSLAKAARAHGACLVHYSTDFVFDGPPTRTEPYTEDDEPKPRSVYGASKLLGEWLAALAPRHYVFRVESLFGGPQARSSIDRIVEALAAGREARVFADRVVSPSYVEDVARATIAALRREIPAGLYHCVNGGSATWLEVGRAIARVGGYDARLLVPVRVADVTMRAPRPQYCALSNGKLAAAGIPMPSWEDALARYLRARRRPTPA